MSKSPTLTIGSVSPATLGDGAVPEVDVATQLAMVLSPAYRVRDKLGSGGFGSVYRAVHNNTGQDVAVKILRLQATWTPLMAANQIARFEREAALCATLRHPNIVRLLDQGHTRANASTTEGAGGAFYYAIYEYVPGETLRSLLDREGQLSVERTAELMGQVLDALASAHAAGIVHRGPFQNQKPSRNRDLIRAEKTAGKLGKIRDLGLVLDGSEQRRAFIGAHCA